MKCEDLQLNISLFPDGMLSADEESAVDSHLVACPLCRQKIDDYQALRLGLSRFPKVDVPADLSVSVKSAVRSEIFRSRHSRFGFVSPNFRDFLQMRVMPYAVGSVASLVLGFGVLWMLLSNTAAPIGDLASRQELTAPVFLPKVPSGNTGDTITPSGLAAERLSVSGESPSINPQGALIALTKSLMRGGLKDSEVVVVADVFSDGLASVEEVVLPLDDAATVFELEKALRQDSTDAPFVPAFLDKRADSVRVVLKIQRVNVKTNFRQKRR
jgi:hypothetical protein